MLYSSFQEHTIIWIIISGVIGAFLSASANFLFQNLIPQWQQKKATRIAIQKYSFPILHSARYLQRTIQEMLVAVNITNWDDQDLGYYHSRLLYSFGIFFGWCRVLSNESFLEYQETSEIERSKSEHRFASYYDIVFKSISDVTYFLEADGISLEDRESARIPALIVSCIGELMIKESKESKELSSKIINFLEFNRYYNQNPEFKKWFRYLDDLLKKTTISDSDARWNRLSIFYTALSVFIDYLNRNDMKLPFHKSIQLKYLFPVIRILSHKERKLLIAQSSLFGNIHPKVKGELNRQLGKLNYDIGYID